LHGRNKRYYRSSFGYFERLKEKIKRKAQISGWLLLGEHGNFQLSLYNIHKIGATKLMSEYI